MGKQFVRQHEPLRIPDHWRGQDRVFVIQINRLLDEIYAQLGMLEKKIADLQPEEEGEEET